MARGHGPRPVDRGPWPVPPRGPGLVALGPWRMAHGPWPMPRPMACGLRPMASGAPLRPVAPRAAPWRPWPRILLLWKIEVPEAFVGSRKGSGPRSSLLATGRMSSTLRSNEKSSRRGRPPLTAPLDDDSWAVLHQTQWNHLALT